MKEKEISLSMKRITAMMPSCMALQWVEGERGFALRFDGVDDTVAIPHSASLMPTDAITLAAWVKIEGQAQEHYGIIGKSGYSIWL
jgi:hypothetical protein